MKEMISFPFLVAFGCVLIASTVHCQKDELHLKSEWRKLVGKKSTLVQDKMKTLIHASLDERHEHQDNEHDEHFVGQGIQRMKSLIQDHRILDRDETDDVTNEEYEEYVESLSEDEFARLMFYVYDDDENKEMTIEELTAMFSAIALDQPWEEQLDNDEIQAVFAEADSNGNGTIDEDEFVAGEFVEVEAEKNCTGSMETGTS